jgi:hypothetical protein
MEHSAAAHGLVSFTVRVAERTALAGTLTLSAGGSVHAA